MRSLELVQNINSFIEDHRETSLSHAEILDLLHIYKCWRYRKKDQASRRSENKSFSRKVLYYIAQHMHWSDFSCSNIVAEVLKYAFEEDGHLTFIFRPNEEQNLTLIQTNSLNFLEYFLQHAYKEKSLYRGYRLPCTDLYTSEKTHPVEMATQIANPKLLYQMLRFGAILSYDINYNNPVVKRLRYCWNEFKSLKIAINSIINVNPNLLSLECLELEQELQLKYQNILNCCNLILQDTAYWHPCILSTINFRNGYLPNKNIMAFISIFSANVIPDFERHFTMPMKLKEICRLCVRKTLNRNWLLPHGINSLPYPQSLKKYLDLVIIEDIGRF